MLAKPVQLTCIGLGLIFIALVQHFTPESLIHWHFVWERLYYIPIITGGLLFGWRTGLSVAVIAGFFHLFLLQEKTPAYDTLDSYLDSVVFALFGLLTGILADRERQQRQALEEASTKLEILYRQLQDNFENMKRADRMAALGHISAGLAHEIRNPLSAIDGAAGILRRRAQNNEQETEFLDIITAESRRLNRLLSNFIDFARPRSPDLHYISVEELLNSTIILASHATRDGRIRFQKRLEPGLRSLLCDPEQIKQVLLNMALNAIQAMPDGGDIVFSAAQGNKNLLIQISDQGKGIPVQNVDSIFDPFFTTKETGTGLGLSVAYQIVEQHGGQLRLEANSVHGATFAIRLPNPDGAL